MDPPLGGMLSLQCLGVLGLAKFRPTIRVETFYREAYPLTKVLFLGVLVAQE